MRPVITVKTDLGIDAFDPGHVAPKAFIQQAIEQYRDAVRRAVEHAHPNVSVFVENVMPGEFDRTTIDWPGLPYADYDTIKAEVGLIKESVWEAQAFWPAAD